MHGKDLRFILLFDLYGELLSDSQKEMFDLYYNDDFSLSEVAENTGITRQGVRDSIKRSEEILLSYEEKLRLAERQETVEHEVEKIRQKLIDLRNILPDGPDVINDILARLDIMKF